MTIDVKVYDNGDHTAIFWIPKNNAVIPECRGFAVQRKHNGKEDYLHSFVGFKDKEPFPKDAWKWPLQRYMWWDYLVKPGDTVQYRVIPVTGKASELDRKDELASEWTSEMKVTGQCTPHVSAYFNKGIVAAQWVSRDLDKEAQGQNRQTALKTIIQEVGDPLRDALAGLLKVEILKLLASAKGGQIYAALYELNDPELEASLITLGKSANLILANGAFTPAQPDESKAARDKLRAGGVNVFDRMVTSGHFAHNKFVVFCDSKGKPEKVLTGSTNWTVTGLCTQANNGLIIDDPKVAESFLAQWHLLREAGNDFPKTLVAANSKIKQFVVDGMQITPWFVPTSSQQDMDYARKLIADAKDGIFFLFFNPGTYQEDPHKETLLQNIIERKEPGLYVRGVDNQEITNLTGGKTQATGAPVELIGGAGSGKLTNKVLVPANIKKQFHDFEDEALRASMVMVHSKVVVLDPFGAHPVVMTGSHNLGVKASSKNDDNLVILEGPEAGPLAAAYAIHIIAVFQAYRWNHFVTEHQSDTKSWHGLQDDDKWQAGHLQGDNLAELQFWLSEKSDAPAAHAATASHSRAHATKRPVKHVVKTARTPTQRRP